MGRCGCGVCVSINEVWVVIVFYVVIVIELVYKYDIFYEFGLKV